MGDQREGLSGGLEGGVKWVSRGGIKWVSRGRD